jgi:hypothetical protein
MLGWSLPQFLDQFSSFLQDQTMRYRWNLMRWVARKYQGERLNCMKSAKTMNCKMCMVERKEILQWMKTNKHKLINDNSDIYAQCSCKKCRFHKFSVLIQLRRGHVWCRKKSPPQDTPNSQEYARYSLLNYAPLVTQRRQLRCPLRTPFLWNNVPGLPPRSPTAIPMPNLELAQVQHHYKYNYLSVEVWGWRLACVLCIDTVLNCFRSPASLFYKLPQAN